MKITRRIELDWFWCWPWEWQFQRIDLLGIVFIDVGPLMVTWWAE